MNVDKKTLHLVNFIRSSGFVGAVGGLYDHEGNYRSFAWETAASDVSTRALSLVFILDDLARLSEAATDCTSCASVAHSLREAAEHIRKAVDASHGGEVEKAH